MLWTSRGWSLRGTGIYLWGGSLGKTAEVRVMLGKMSRRGSLGKFLFSYLVVSNQPMMFTLCNPRCCTVHAKQEFMCEGGGSLGKMLRRAECGCVCMYSIFMLFI